MSSVLYSQWLDGLRSGAIIPYLGPGALADVRHVTTGQPMPATSEALILAMNQGKPMAPKLMYEFSRAAMNVELKRGRSAVNKFLQQLYLDPQWTPASLHAWLASLSSGYVIDINRDVQLQKAYAKQDHQLVVGLARMGGTAFRYKCYRWDGEKYQRIDALEAGAPILFKPMGTPLPEPNFIASDADYVDYITELMGGFAIPDALKEVRKGKQYLLLGMRLNRDTERMVMSDLIFNAAQPAGWVLIAQPTAKERRFCSRMGLEIVEAELSDFMSHVGAC